MMKKAVANTFDSQGRRTEYKSVTNGTQNTWLRFLYDGYLCVQVLYSNEPYNVFKEFVWDPTEPVATRPLVFRYAPNSLNLFYAFDGNKNVSDVFYRMTSNGIGAHYDYAPFGTTTRTHRDSSASFDIVALNPFRFSSEYYDSELDLVYYNYRHYSPSLGRFLSRDPIEEQGGLNLYVFVGGGNTLQQVDVLGLFGDGTQSYVPIEWKEVYDYDTHLKRWVLKTIVTKWGWKENPDGTPLGHFDFSNVGGGTPCGKFDWTAEDHDLTSSPFTPWGIASHFRSKEAISGVSKEELEEILKELKKDIVKKRYLLDSDIGKAIANCDGESYQSLMHQYQDTFVHYEAGWRWYTLGHLWGSIVGPDPDNNEALWRKAEEMTIYFNGEWMKNCCCTSQGKWKRRLRK